MKKYRLKQWYPSLKQDWSKGDIAEWFDGYYWNKGKVISNGLSKNEVENNPDFWELIEEKYCDCNIPIFTLNSTFCRKCLKDIEEKKPLFVTDDGVGVYDIDSLVFIVKDDFKKSQRFALAFKQNKNDMKSFYHESNADEYIWRNKPVFSYEDFIKWANDINASFEELSQLAKERIKS